VSEHEPAFEARLSALRAELDRGFERPRESVRPHVTELLAIRVGDEPYAVRLSEVQALFADRPLTRLPTPVPELIGLCAIRGAIAPVYDLAPLLGRAVQRAHAPRWLVLAQHRELIALAFDALEAQVHVPTAEIASPALSGGESAVQLHGALRPLIRMATVLEAIERRVRPLQEP
jgi:chemotaxis signal transduction protein